MIDWNDGFRGLFSALWRVVRTLSLWIGMAVLGVAALGSIAFTSYQSSSAIIEEKTILWLNLNQPILQKPGYDFFHTSQGVLVTDVLRGIDYAKDDPRVHGIVVLLGETYISMAEAQEIGAALRDFASSGKDTIAYSEDLGSLWNGSSEYLLAAQLDTIWLQTTGGVGLNGFAIETPYIRDALDEIGVKPDLVQRHEYKSAADTFSKRAMPDQVAQNYRGLLRDWTEQLERGLNFRDLRSTDFVSDILDGGPYLASEALALGLVDYVGYEYEFFDFLDERFGEAVPSITPTQYLTAVEQEIEGPFSEPAIGVIYGVGEIGPDEESEGFDPYSVLSGLYEVLENDQIAAVVLRIDSPGGAYQQSDMLWHAIRQIQDVEKPVIVSIADTAASGGYYVSMAADEIFAPSGALVGSIGVFGGKPVLGELWSKLGVNWNRVTVGKNAAISSMITPYSDSERARFTTWIDAIYDDFTAKAAKSRDLSREAINLVARGRIFSGERGVANGLIDQEGSFLDALERARILANLDGETRPRLITLPEPPGPWEKAQDYLKKYSGLTAQHPLVDQIKTMRVGVQSKSFESEAMDAVSEALAERLGIDAALLEGPPGLLTMPPIHLVR